MDLPVGERVIVPQGNWVFADNRIAAARRIGICDICDMDDLDGGPGALPPATCRRAGRRAGADRG